jgi:hypothetical protein
MERSSLIKLVTAGAVLSITLTLYILFGNHSWLQHRPDLELDLAALSLAPTGEQVLERYRDLKLRCAPQDTLLGAEACGTQLRSFNGIASRHVAFYFDGQQNLTAWKLTVAAADYPALREHLRRRYGEPEQTTADESILTQVIGQGVLALRPAAHGGEAEILWLYDPRLQPQS